MRRNGRLRSAAGVCTLAFAACLKVGASLLPPQPPSGRTEVERQGRHVLQIAGGCGCHGPNFAGWKQGRPDTFPRAAPYGERFVGPFAVVPAPNITSDVETGIGGWTDAEIERAVTDGVTPYGTRLSPIMPYRAYHGMSRADVRALVAYLHRLTPIHNVVPAPSGPAAPRASAPLANALVPRLGEGGSKEAAMSGEAAPDVRVEGGVELGRYLVRHVSSCSDCHGETLSGKVLHNGAETVVAPNITPDRDTGIGKWTEDDIATYLRTGSRPDGGLAQSAMAGLILSSFSHFTPVEAHAVAQYLKSQPPVRHRP